MLNLLYIRISWILPIAIKLCFAFLLCKLIAEINGLCMSYKAINLIITCQGQFPILTQQKAGPLETNHRLHVPLSHSAAITFSMGTVKCLKLAIQVVIFLSCFSFVVYQCYECIKKYIESPQGTMLTTVSAEKAPFPVITICPTNSDLEGNNYFNQTILEHCGIK